MNSINNFEIDNKELQKFNWGAFVLGWIWGLYNKTYITLIQLPLLFIPKIGPLLTLICSIWFGFKGNLWTYNNVKYANLEEYKKRQKQFAIASSILILANITMLMLIYQIFTINSNLLDENSKILEIYLTFNTILIITVLIWLLNIKSFVKTILFSFFLAILVYLNFIPVLEYYAEYKYNKGDLINSGKTFEKLHNYIKFYPIYNKTPLFNYENKLVEINLRQKNLKQAIYWAELAEQNKIIYPIEENSLTSLYIFNGDYNKAIERGAKYKICLLNKDWNCAVNELAPKIETPKGGKVFNGKVYADYKFYLARAIAYKNLNNDKMAQKDFQIATMLNDSPDVKLAFYNYKTYFIKPEFLD